MPKPKFKPGNPGRPKGATNKLTRDLRQMILHALDKAGGVDYLVQCARDNPQSFLALVGKILPKDVVIDQTVRAYVVMPEQAQSIEAWHAGVEAQIAEQKHAEPQLH